MGIFNNISTYRKMVGLTQEEFALMIGFSQEYLSHVEVHRKPLLEDMADSIAHVLNKIVSDIVYHEANLKNADEPDADLLQEINPELLRIGHNISKYPSELHDEVLKLISEDKINKYKLDYMLEHGEKPSDTDLVTVEEKLEGMKTPEMIIRDVLKLSCNKEVLEAIKKEAKKKVKLKNMKMESKQ